MLPLLWLQFVDTKSLIYKRYHMGKFPYYKNTSITQKAFTYMYGTFLRLIKCEMV